MASRQRAGSLSRDARAARSRCTSRSTSMSVSASAAIRPWSRLSVLARLAPVETLG